MAQRKIPTSPNQISFEQELFANPVGKEVQSILRPQHGTHEFYVDLFGTSINPQELVIREYPEVPNYPFKTDLTPQQLHNTHKTFLEIEADSSPPSTKLVERQYDLIYRINNIFMLLARNLQPHDMTKTTQRVQNRHANAVARAIKCTNFDSQHVSPDSLIDVWQAISQDPHAQEDQQLIASVSSTAYQHLMELTSHLAHYWSIRSVDEFNSSSYRQYHQLSTMTNFPPNINLTGFVPTIEAEGNWIQVRQLSFREPITTSHNQPSYYRERFLRNAQIAAVMAIVFINKKRTGVDSIRFTSKLQKQKLRHTTVFLNKAGSTEVHMDFTNSHWQEFLNWLNCMVAFKTHLENESTQQLQSQVSYAYKE